MAARNLFIAVGLALALAPFLTLRASAQTLPPDQLPDQLPDQMVYWGLEGDPIGDPRSAPVRFVASWMGFPDSSEAQLYRLSWWTKIGNAHAVQVALDYVGVESERKFRYGGGRPRVRWTSRIGPQKGFGFALDLAGHLPLGDPSLFPLGARAPMGIVRLRASLLDVGPLRVWFGWWARRVSPPSASNRQDPLSVFDSGSGYDLLMEWNSDHVDLEGLLHLPVAGSLDRAFHWTLDADWWVSRDVALRTGVGIDTGAAQDRSYDLLFRVGATWRAPRTEDR